MRTNRLAAEKSPYLLQHAHNPVDWYPWGEEAFAKAREEQKPIFLSVGYSTCHWCHVMERESFENEAIAQLMNRDFVSIKVDREERPDIDRIYMAYIQATSGGGGWPMSVWLTPDLHPFVGGTYFPPENRYGRPGFPLILERIAGSWKQDREKIVASSARVMKELRGQTLQAASGPDHIDPSVSDACFQQFRRMFDGSNGGFGNAPKFPRPSMLNFLLRYWKRTGNDDALEMVVDTLLAMEKGGMHDQLGGGFHRYSVDERWFVPHFEKMLYDQAQLAVSYLEAYQATKSTRQLPILAETARKILEYVLRDMTAPEGGFFSAEDADSIMDPTNPHEKGEGAFYIWSWKEVYSLLPSPQSLFFAHRYGMESNGNVSEDPHGEFTGRNILFQAHSVEETAKYFDERVEQVADSLRGAEQVLLEHRGKRPRPHLDDKILTAWNGLMISAFAKAAGTLGDARYHEAAVRAASFILERMTEGATLMRRYRDGGAAIEGMLDDYAFFIGALLDLYETDLNARWLTEAISLQDKMLEAFEDSESGGFYSSRHADAAALMRIKDDYDGAEPAGNSLALTNLFRLAAITGHARYEISARKLIAAFHNTLTKAPYGLPQMLCGIEFDLAPKREIVFAGPFSRELFNDVQDVFDPFRILVGSDRQLGKLRPEIAAMADADTGLSQVYVCRNFTCQRPVSSREELRALLESD